MEAQQQLWLSRKMGNGDFGARCKEFFEAGRIGKHEAYAGDLTDLEVMRELFGEGEGEERSPLVAHANLRNGGERGLLADAADN